MNLGLSRKSKNKAAKSDAPIDHEGYVDPAEQVRRRVDKSVSIGSPLLYPF